MTETQDVNAAPPGYPVMVLAALLVAGLFAGVPGKVFAAEKKAETLKFMGVKVKPYNGTYVVLRDVSIRAKPKTKSKRLGRYKAGRRIQVVGFAAGAWVAVRDKGRDVGFVYAKVLLPLIDGTLARDLTGTASAKGKDKGDPDTDCLYRISFEGKSAVEGQVFEIADYDIVWDCTRAKRKVKFRTPMFITEAPSQLSQKRKFQITVDVVDLDGGYDEIFSTFILFNMEKDLVLYDGVSIKKYGRGPATTKLPAKTVSQALKGAAEIALQAWNKAAWKDLIKDMPKYLDSATEKSSPAKTPDKTKN